MKSTRSVFQEILYNNFLIQPRRRMFFSTFSSINGAGQVKKQQNFFFPKCRCKHLLLDNLLISPNGDLIKAGDGMKEIQNNGKLMKTITQVKALRIIRCR